MMMGSSRMRQGFKATLIVSLQKYSTSRVRINLSFHAPCLAARNIREDMGG